ncbi:hypothetical protein, partial [Enterococcus casseliflavus]|uniref:hypothetical protein n=1 Tax=Enterococcus casseliflavus TaxID=37734 RepID=UPI003D0990F0
MYRFTEKILTAGVVMNAESSQFNEEYMLAMKLLGDKAYCWKKNDHTYEVGRRVRDMPGQTGLGYDVWGTGPSWEVAFAQVRERHERENK